MVEEGGDEVGDGEEGGTQSHDEVRGACIESKVVKLW